MVNAGGIVWLHLAPAVPAFSFELKKGLSSPYFVSFWVFADRRVAFHGGVANFHCQ